MDETNGPLNSLLDVEVFHVDFGSSEWVSVGDVKPLVAKFLSLPGQVVKCRLANLKPEVIEGKWFGLLRCWLFKAASTLRRRNLKTEVSLSKPIKCFLSTLHRRNSRTQQSFWISRKSWSGKSPDYRDVIVFEKFCFQNVLRPHENEKPAFSISPDLNSVFENLRFRDGLVWTLGVTVERMLRFQISPAQFGLGLRIMKTRN